jgi:CubicO group peptidase (beta-lactamase class C family)
MRTFRLISLAVAVLFLVAPARQRALQSAEPAKPPADDISSLLAASIKKHKLPGMAAGIFERGRFTALGAAGVRCRGHEEKITTDDEFHIGSDTKSMTATLIALYVNEGKLRWDSTPDEILSGRGVKEIDPAWKKVTLEELLTHRGGVRPNPDLGTIQSVVELRPRAQRLRICRAVLKKPPDHPPGKDFLYSNTGYMIAAAMLEAVADDAWESLIVRRLFQPLGMKHVGFGPPGAEPSKTGKTPSPPTITEPWGHRPSGEPVKPDPEADNPACFGPAGRVHLTLADWAKYAALHLSAGASGRKRDSSAPQQLLPVATLKRLHTPFDGPIDKHGAKYAMGWGVVELPFHRGTVLAHDGSNMMWYASIQLYLADDRAIFVVTNQGGDGATAACSEVSVALAMRRRAGRGPK